MDPRSASAGRLNLPFGFRFDPTNVDLLEGYLIPKLKGEELPTSYVVDLDDVYGCQPDQLPLNRLERTIKNEGYFFTKDPRQDKVDSKQRASINGYWKVYEEDVPIEGDLGFKTELYFHDANGNKSNWKMIEYRCHPARIPPSCNVKNHIICKVKLITKDEEDDEF